LAERFRRLGAAEAELWAKSEIRENIPHFTTFVLLREFWRLVVPEGNRDWPRRCYGTNDDGGGGALRRVLDRVDRDDLTKIVRAMQIDLLRELVCVIDGLFNLGPELRDVRWGFFELDEKGHPVRPIDCLHESIDDEDLQLSLRSITERGGAS
jgi:hypothetical protein